MNSPKRCRCGDINHQRCTYIDCRLNSINNSNKKMKTSNDSTLTPILNTINLNVQRAQLGGSSITMVPRNIFNENLAIATQTTKFKCLKCNKDYKTQRISYQHKCIENVNFPDATSISASNSATSQRFKCLKCNKDFKTQRILYQHKCKENVNTKEFCVHCKSSTHKRKSSLKCPFNWKNLPINQVNILLT